MRSALRLKQEMERRKAREQELLQLSQALISRKIHAEEAMYQDALTGIHNRRAFDKKLQDAWLDCYIAQKPLGLVMLDLEHFKQCNDTYGHLIGDHCLKLVGQSLPVTGPVCFSARYGGEEFVVLLPGAELETARQIAGTDFSEAGQQEAPSLSASLGVASVMPGEVPDASTLIAQADAALYRAKQRERNCVSA